MISLDLHHKRFAHTTILSNIKLEINRGERIAIQGPSGVGKTSLLRILAGLDNRFEGELITTNKLALMFQKPTLLPWRTLEENLSIFHPQAKQDVIDSAIEHIGLTPHRGKFPAQLSLGQQRRLALARCFLSPVDTVLLDEAFVSLDYSLKQEMLALTDHLLHQSGAALVLVTHDKQEAEALRAKVLSLQGLPARLISVGSNH